MFLKLLLPSIIIVLCLSASLCPPPDSEVCEARDLGDSASLCSQGPAQGRPSVNAHWINKPVDMHCSEGALRPILLIGMLRP